MDEDDRDMVATIPIQVPLSTFASAPDRDATSAPEAAAPTPVLSDAELLAAFVQRRDADAFTQIVERYGPMVYRVALRAVADRHLADDVYQATFLVLAQSARQIKHGELLPAWLHGSARNIARRALADRHIEHQKLALLASQSSSEKGGEMTTSTEVDPFAELARLNEQQLLDEELQQLPEASRTPLVLFYLEEKSQAEIAQLMGLTVEAVEGRLRRAKQELRQRLIRRGVFLSTIVAAATVLTPSLATAAPASTLVSSTIATALGTTALGGTLASTSLATGATTAAKLAAQEVAAMSAASKATAILITTVASTTVATGLMFGAIVSSMSGGGAGATPVAQAANVSPPTLGRFEIPDDGFSGLGEEPVLLALAEIPGSVSGPADSDEPNDEIPLTRQYDVSDFDPGLRKKFVDFYKIDKTVTFHDNIMKITASQEDHWLYEGALDHYREKRDQGKLNESEFDAVLSSLRSNYAKAPDAALQNLKAAEQELVDREQTHGPFDAGTRDLQRRVEMWRAVSNAVRNPEQSKPSSGSTPPKSEPNQEAKPVVYQIADLDIDHKWIALEYARTLDVQVASHESTQSFVVRANVEVHQQVNEFIGNLRKAAYAKNIESVSRQISWRLKTHSDNHPAVEQLRQLLAQLQRVEKKHGELQAEAMNNDLFSQHRKLAFFAGVIEEKPIGAGGEGAIAPQPESNGGDHKDTDPPISREDVVRLVKSRDELVSQKDAEIAKWQQAYRVEQVDKERQRDELSRANKEYSERVSRLNQIVDFQRQKLDELTPGCVWDLADGKITIVDNNTGTVWLNLGRKNGLRTQTTFSVYDNTHQGIARGPKDVKARIEVVELRETSSIARVVEEERDRPIIVGDEIFSPAWCEGLTEHFAIVGSFDLNTDGKMDAQDRRILKDLLDNAGSEIDLEITAEGLREPADAKLTADTKWLLVGDIGDPASAVNDPEILKQLLAVQKQHDLLVQEAREIGIKIVSLKDFLTYLGWKPESRLNVPGAGVPFQLKAGARKAGANPDAIPPVTDEQIETTFQTILERNPTQEELEAWRKACQLGGLSLLEVRARMLANETVFNQVDRDLMKFIHLIYQLELQRSPTTEEAKLWTQRAGDLQDDRATLAHWMLQEFEDEAAAQHPAEAGPPK